MPNTLDDLQTRRLKYNVAWAAHGDCLRSLTEARLRGDEPPPGLVEKEAKARRALEFARKQLRLAITESITGHHQVLAEYSTAPALAAELPTESTSDTAKPR